LSASLFASATYLADSLGLEVPRRTVALELSKVYHKGSVRRRIVLILLMSRSTRRLSRTFQAYALWGRVHKPDAAPGRDLGTGVRGALLKVAPLASLML